MSDGGNGRQAVRQINPESLGSAGDPPRCQPGEREFISDGTRMGSSGAVDGSGGPESRPATRLMPCVRNSCVPQTRLGKTHQTHHTPNAPPAIPVRPLQTHLMKLSENQRHITSLVSLVGFIPPRLSLGRKYHLSTPRLHLLTCPTRSVSSRLEAGAPRPLDRVGSRPWFGQVRLRTTTLLYTCSSCIRRSISGDFCSLAPDGLTQGIVAWRLT
jgi:hypothetical protein